MFPDFSLRPMNLNFLHLTTALFLSIFIAACSPEQKFYISPDGSDQNNGTKNHPFATLERAKEAIKNNQDRPVTIYLREGYYRLQQSFILEEENAPGDAPILISAYPGEDVHLIGGREINGFRALDVQSKAGKQIEPKYHNQILQIDLKALGIIEYGEMSARGFYRSIQPSGLELYFNERPMTLARWPNNEWATIEDVPETLDGKGFSYKGMRPANWLEAQDVWLHGYWKYDWADTYVKVADIDTIEKVIISEAPYSGYPYTKGKRFYALNVLEELDVPGEWYLDRETGILYFWPPSDTKDARIFISLLQDPLIQLKNTSHVTIKNLTLEYACGAGVEIIGGSNNVIEDCTLRNLGTVAVSIGKLEGNLSPLIYDNTLYNGNAGTGNGISGCVIHTTGEGGVILGGGDRKTLTPGNNFVKNCDIYDCSRWVRTYRAGIFMYGTGNIVTHNNIHDLPHTAVFFWGNDHLMEYNEIHHVCMETGDAGAFYNGRDWTQRG
ncbi:MAG: right-handed parallel beta-helix repeat-containing protein, partial [Cyclobacteriaceae bacterium]|nr:right-handed parallel beta-helix repeat-containing protein [Cyclobacteriaceae bacterium]